jgi:transcriptional regulator with XRE-family HTH domain
MAREARRRRIELGLSQARLASSLGVSTTQIGRWERGEAVPTPAQLRALAEVLDLTPSDIDSWLDDLALGEVTPTISIEIMEGGSAPAPPDPWEVPPHKLISPPVLDRAALVVRSADRTPRSADGDDAALVGRSAWDLRRRMWRDERRIRRDMEAERRQARAREAEKARRQVERQARQARTGALPTAVPGGLAERVAPPAGAANTGSVFPVPDTRTRSETVTYRSAPGGDRPDERSIYAGRVLMTIAVLIGLAGLLWWALGAFGEGIGSVLDLFRGDETDTDPIVDALRMVGWV